MGDHGLQVGGQVDDGYGIELESLNEPFSPLWI